MAYLNKITLYMTDVEHQELKARAEKAGLSMSAYVKKKCIGGGLAELFKPQN